MKLQTEELAWISNIETTGGIEYGTISFLKKKVNGFELYVGDNY